VALDWAVVIFALSSMVDKPPPGPPPAAPLHQTARLSQKNRPQDVALFRTFAGPEDNWLPADNYQEGPREAVAHRTSPTNIGLMLLSNLGAYDLGYLCAGQLIDKTRKSFKSMEALTRFRGHFFNWYDTRTLQPLAPQYVSTVDSGNLADTC